MSKIFTLKQRCIHKIASPGFAFPFMLNALLDRLHFRWTMRAWALFELVVGGIALLGIKPRLPVPKYHSSQRPRFLPPSVRFLKRSVFWVYVSVMNIRK